MLWIATILFLAYVWAIHPYLPHRDITALKGFDYAHRGLWNTNQPGADNRPENSLAAFRAAVEKGYGIELDVHLTRDGALVVHHDDSLLRLTGVERVIADSTLAEIRACRLPNGEPVPTFDEVLDVVAGRIPMIVELKMEKSNAAALSRAVCDRMQSYAGPWCMESFSPAVVKWFRRHAPEIIRGQLAYDHVGKSKTASGFLRNLAVASMLQNLWARPDFIAFEAKSVKWYSLPIHLLRLMKPWFAAWTIRTQADMDRLRGKWDLQIFEHFEPRKR